MCKCNADLITTVFFPAPSGGSYPALRWPAQAKVPAFQRIAQASADRWTDFAVCSVCPAEWNVDFAGPAFIAGPAFDDRYISTLTLRVTIPGVTSYPVRTTGYVYAVTGEYLGELDLRYFRAGAPGPLHIDLRPHSIPGSACILIAFQIGGGGSPRVPHPPLVTSVSIEATLSAAVGSEAPESAAALDAPGTAGNGCPSVRARYQDKEYSF